MTEQPSAAAEALLGDARSDATSTGNPPNRDPRNAGRRGDDPRDDAPRHDTRPRPDPSDGEAPLFDVVPFLPVRRAYVDVLAAGRRKHVIHGLVEVDVTEARARLRRIASDTGVALSFTAFLLGCVATAVDENRILHAYRQRNRLVLFRDVDVNTQIEADLDGQKVVRPLIVRAANRKSVPEISDEIRRAQRGDQDDPEGDRRYRATVAAMAVPRVVRSLGWRVVTGNPLLFKRFGGTVGMSAVGMFGAGGGWGIPIAPPTLMVTVGGIARKPRFVGDELADRELLALTVSVDHAIVDGAPAARFSRRLAELVESGHGLESPADVSVAGDP